MDYRKHMLEMNPFEDPRRCTGRTTRMLLEAIQSFLYGYDVIVTAFTYKYSQDLMMQVADTLRSLNVQDVKIYMQERRIKLNGHEMIFTQHGITLETHQLDYNKTYLLYDDHFNPERERR